MLVFSILDENALIILGIAQPICVVTRASRNKLGLVSKSSARHLYCPFGSDLIGICVFQAHIFSSFFFSNWRLRFSSTRFLFFFFFSQPQLLTKFSVNSALVHCSQTHKLQFLATFLLKMILTVLFTYLKIILLQYFQFSVFNFNKINSIQTTHSHNFQSTYRESHNEVINTCQASSKYFQNTIS